MRLRGRLLRINGCCLPAFIANRMWMSRGQPPLRGLVNFTRVAFYSAPSIRTNNPSYYTLLSNRSLVAVKGPDATKLLHSIVTADMNARQNIVQYGMMLNAQGRVLYDVIIYSKGEDGHLLECDAMVVDDVVQHLKKFSLRSKVEISKTEDMKLWSFYQPLGGDWPQQLLESTVNGVHFCNLDPRVKALGLRTVTRLDTEASAIWTHLQLGSLEQYHQHRLKTGVPEGVAEIVPGSCFPLEFNLDYMNGGVSSDVQLLTRGVHMFCESLQWGSALGMQTMYLHLVAGLPTDIYLLTYINNHK